jgi:hypothetical protein
VGIIGVIFGVDEGVVLDEGKGVDVPVDVGV